MLRDVTGWVQELSKYTSTFMVSTVPSGKAVGVGVGFGVAVVNGGGEVDGVGFGVGVGLAVEVGSGVGVDSKEVRLATLNAVSAIIVNAIPAEAKAVGACIKLTPVA